MAEGQDGRDDEPHPLSGPELEALLERTRAAYGTAEISESGVDVSQLRANRRLTPAQRLQAMKPALQFYAEAQAGTRERTRHG